MIDAELEKWWPDLGIVIAELRRAERPDVAYLLLEAVRAGTCSAEILGSMGIILRNHRALCSQMSDSGKSAWDAVMADVYRAYPLRRLAEWFARLTMR